MSRADDEEDEAIAPREDPWRAVRGWTPARVGLGRAGGALPTREVLALRAAHAQAYDAVHRPLDRDALLEGLAAVPRPSPSPVLEVRSRAPDRATYLRRPDLGRTLDAPSRALLERHGRASIEPHATSTPLEAREVDLVFVLADGLSPLAVERHAPGLLAELAPKLAATTLVLGPWVLATQARVALGDEVGAALGARMVVVLVGERPGLSAVDSLGAYLTYDPHPARARTIPPGALGAVTRRSATTDADRNCLSNIRPEGLAYPLAAHKLLYLILEARRRGLSGVALKDEAPKLAILEANGAPRGALPPS